MIELNMYKFIFNLILGFSIKALMFTDCFVDVKELGGSYIYMYTYFEYLKTKNYKKNY